MIRGVLFSICPAMEGSESEAVFDACNLNPQLFINEVLNSVDDIVDGAFDFYLQKASALASGSNGGTDRFEELAQGVSSLRRLTQGVLDKRLSMWEKYCIAQCFIVPEGFVLPEAQDSSSTDLLPYDRTSEEELDSQLDLLRKKLLAVRQESAGLQKEIHALEKQSSLSSSFDAFLAQAIQLYDNSVQQMFQELGNSTLKLKLKMDSAIQTSGKNVEYSWVGSTFGSGQQGVAHDPGLSLKLEDIQGALRVITSLPT